MQCSAVQFSAVQCKSLQCSAVQYSVKHCSAVQCSLVQCSAVKCSEVQWTSSILHLGSIQPSENLCQQVLLYWIESRRYIQSNPAPLDCITATIWQHCYKILTKYWWGKGKAWDWKKISIVHRGIVCATDNNLELFCQLARLMSIPNKNQTIMKSLSLE